MTLYVSDLDGTLLDSSAQISSKSTELLNKAIKNNANFTIATARTPATIVPILKNINMKLPVIAMNGCSIYDIKTNKYLHTTCIIPELIPELKRLITNADLNAFAYTMKNDKLFVYHNKLTNPYQINFYNERKSSNLKTFIESDLPDNSKVLYFTIIDTENKINKLYNKIKDMPQLSVIKYADIYNKNVFNLEIYNHLSSKSNAINYIKKHFNFDRLITFGDNLNDIPMFKISDECYAVENAVQQLKDISTKTIGLNIDNSVAKYILNDSNKKTST